MSLTQDRYSLSVSYIVIAIVWEKIGGISENDIPTPRVRGGVGMGRFWRVLDINVPLSLLPINVFFSFFFFFFLLPIILFFIIKKFYQKIDKNLFLFLFLVIPSFGYLLQKNDQIFLLIFKINFWIPFLVISYIKIDQIFIAIFFKEINSIYWLFITKKIIKNL